MMIVITKVAVMMPIMMMVVVTTPKLLQLQQEYISTKHSSLTVTISLHSVCKKGYQ